MVMKRMKGVSALAMASMLAARAEAATSPFSAARFALNAADGSSRLSDSFSPTEGIAAIQPDKRVKVEPNEIIRLQFTLPLKTAGGQGFSVESSSEYVYEENGQLKKNESFSSHAVKEQNGLPEQIFVQLVHTENDGRRRPVSFLPQVNKQNGKVTWSQRVDRLPLSTLTTQNPTYTLRLLISSAARDAAKPFSLDLGQLFIPHLAIEAGSPTGPMSQRESEARELGFYPWEERRHTFRKEVTEGMPGATKSLVVLAVLVTVPWIILAGLVSFDACSHACSRARFATPGR